MRAIVPLLLILASTASAFEIGLDGYAFGASYHTDRDAGYREWNPGLGYSVYAKPTGAQWEAFICTGEYANSIHTRTTYTAIGGRAWLERGDWKVGACAAFGGFSGYEKSCGVLAAAFVSWWRVSLEGGALPMADGNAVAACWLRVRLFQD